MGQAKRRGSYEQRKAEGIVRRGKEELERLERIQQRKAERYKQEQERLKAMSPEQRKKAQGSSRAMRTILASAATMGAIVSRDVLDADTTIYPCDDDEY